MMSAAAQNAPLPRIFARLEDPEGAEFARRYRAMLAPLLVEPVPDGSPEEASVCAEMTLLTAQLFQTLGEDAALLFQEDFSAQVDALFKSQCEAAETIVKLAYAHLSSCLEVQLEILSLYAENPDATAVVFGEVAKRSPESIASVIHADPAVRSLGSMTVAVGVALEFGDAHPSQLAFWAKRAVSASRNVRAHLHRFEQDFRGMTARFRAFRAWDNWDEEEIERELSSWKLLTPSRA